jgi:hypothetical protein
MRIVVYTLKEIKKKNGNFIVLLLYIDDMLIFGKDKLMIKGDKIIIKQRLCVETLSFWKECACATSQYCALGPRGFTTRHQDVVREPTSDLLCFPTCFVLRIKTWRDRTHTKSSNTFSNDCNYFCSNPAAPC